MSNMRRIDMRDAVAFPAGLGLANIHTGVAGMDRDYGLRQQGDLLFTKLAEAPVGNRRIASNSLAVSALTGASHIAQGDVTVWQPLDSKGAPLSDLLFLEVGSNGGSVMHEGGDHATMEVESGWHGVSGVNEVDPLDAHQTTLRAAD